MSYGLRTISNRATMVRMRISTCILVSCLLGIILGACTSVSQNSGTCVPGASVACACSSGQQGAQTCTSAGTFATCVCTATLDAGGLGGAGGMGASSSPNATGGQVPMPLDAGAGGAIGGNGGSGGSKTGDAPIA